MTKTYTQKRWSLSDLFPSHDSPEFEGAMESLEGAVTAFEENRPKLAGDIDEKTFQGIIKELEEITVQIHHLSGYAGLWFTEDTQNQDALALQAKIEQFLVTLYNKIMFFNLWWKELNQKNADRLMANAGDLQYWLEEIRHFTPHTLSEPEEKVVRPVSAP